MLLKGIIYFMAATLLECKSSVIMDKIMQDYNQLLSELNNLSAIEFSYEILQQEWTSFKETHNKQYDGQEDQKRMVIFAQNQLLIAKHNDLYEKGLHTYTLKMNKYGDLTAEEFKEIYLMKNMTAEDNEYEESSKGSQYEAPRGVAFPDAIDWRSLGAVTKVKYQGTCGCCWAFSATGALEGYFYRTNNYLVSISEQNLMDCSKRYKNNACIGGRPRFAFQYVKQNNGIDTEDSYKYEGTDRQCRYIPKYAVPSPNKIQYVMRSNESALKGAVATYGPVSVIVNAEDTFRFYEKGVYYSKTCSTENLNHAMLVVGYGVAEYGGEYWLVKNSYGESWGDEGYIMMAKNRSNNCGIATEATFVI